MLGYRNYRLSSMQSIKTFFLSYWLLWIGGINRYQSSIDIDFYRLIFDIDFYRLTTAGPCHDDSVLPYVSPRSVCLLYDNGGNDLIPGLSDLIPTPCLILLFLRHRSLIKNNTKTAVTDILNLHILIMTWRFGCTLHTFSKVNVEI